MPLAEESELISPRRMKYALKKENSTAEGYVSMVIFEKYKIELKFIILMKSLLSR